jgi:hypothetical protein
LLRACEVQQRLEGQPRCELDTALLFGNSTIRQIAGHLAGIALPASSPRPLLSPIPPGRQRPATVGSSGS